MVGIQEREVEKELILIFVSYRHYRIHDIQQKFAYDQLNLVF